MWKSTDWRRRRNSERLLNTIGRFEQALREYRERSWCPDDFADLPTASQHSIVERACQIQEADDRLKDLIQAA
jgi:hypothetical protein